ncbi:hypothetical protein BLX24_30435 [Arsenicibacter rosenii]|uniref:Uncharacterized protein n=1 Tax=Arsenicibacter rosenii TaxID=1750698 RepID=A0A1S2VBZ1_9BACT|nr:hypothetical protein BLX24_30435 [Arsenicibacter rosenii]
MLYTRFRVIGRKKQAAIQKLALIFAHLVNKFMQVNDMKIYIKTSCVYTQPSGACCLGDNCSGDRLTQQQALNS